jgi:PAS domain S-box-containing protein
VHTGQVLYNKRLYKSVYLKSCEVTLNKTNGPKPALTRRHKDTLSELERYKLLIESVQDYAIFLLDTTGHIMTWNKGAEKNKGYKAHEIIGSHFSRFYVQQDVDAKKPEQELEKAQQFGRIEDEDWRVRKDGSRFWANVIITALYDNTGELVGFAKVTRDLTERKQQEDNLRRANSLLRQQQEELQLLNESKDAFISLASHQLRTPATAIKQLLGIMLEGLYSDLPPELLPFVQRAYESNERQIAIVNSLLRVAQLDAGKVMLRKLPTDINQLLLDVIEEQSDSIAERKQHVIFETTPDTVTANVDYKYLRMALENLLDNASKYTYPEGSITITTSSKGGQITISIQDTGVGIGPADLAQLFEKFKRIPNDLSPTVSGSGLGLYWVREVIKLHEGDIEVTSTLHKGTTFTIHLPLGVLHA